MYDDVIEHLEQAAAAMRDKLGNYTDLDFHKKHLLILSIMTLKSRVQELQTNVKKEC